MNADGWKKEATRLKSAITRNNNYCKSAISLSKKLEFKAIVKDLEEKLYYHKLNYFDLVSE